MRNRDSFDMIFKLFPIFFGVVFLLALGAIGLQVYAAYTVVTDPQGAGEFVGQIIRGVISEAAK